MQVTKAFELTGHQNPVFALELSQKPGILFSAGNDKGLVEWNLEKQAFIKVMFPVAASVYAIHCPIGYPLMCAGMRNGDVLIFDFIQQKIIATLKQHTKPIFDIKSAGGKQELLSVHTIKVSSDTVRSISISPNEEQVVFGCRDNMVQVYNLTDYSHSGTLKHHTMAVFTVQYSPDGQYLLSGSRDAQIKIWDVATLSLKQSIAAHLFAVNHILFHPTEPYFASASMDKSIKIWGADDFKLYKIIGREKGYASHQLSVNKLAWYGNQLLSTGDDKRIIAWDVEF
jgi:centriolar protein POC1